MKTVLKTGTIHDKISANVLLAQESAVHNLNSLEALISPVRLNKKRECIFAIGEKTTTKKNHQKHQQIDQSMFFFVVVIVVT
jgi:hypothetical protein